MAAWAVARVHEPRPAASQDALHGGQAHPSGRGPKAAVGQPAGVRGAGHDGGSSVTAPATAAGPGRPGSAVHELPGVVRVVLVMVVVEAAEGRDGGGEGRREGRAVRAEGVHAGREARRVHGRGTRVRERTARPRVLREYPRRCVHLHNGKYLGVKYIIRPEHINVSCKFLCFHSLANSLMRPKNVPSCQSVDLQCSGHSSWPQEGLIFSTVLALAFHCFFFHTYSSQCVSAPQALRLGLCMVLLAS